MSGTEVLEKVNLRVQVTGGVDDADREHLAAEQIEEIERVDRRVAAWLEADPDRQEQFLKQPSAAMAAALGEVPSSGSQELVEGSGEDDEEVLRIAELASFGEPEPAPISVAGIKEPTARNDVTFMLSLGALAEAFEAAITGPLKEALPSAGLWAPLDLPDLGVALSMTAEPVSSRPVLAFVDDTMHLAMRFRTRLKVEVHDIELPLDDIVMAVPLLIETETPPKLRLAILPDPDGAAFGTPSGVNPDQQVFVVDPSVIEKVTKGVVDLMPNLDTIVEDALPDEVKELLVEDGALDAVRDAVASWLASALLGEQLDGTPLLSLLTDIPQRQILCGADGPIDLRARFVPGDEETGRRDGLAIGLGYIDEVDLPGESLIGHGWSSWVEMSNRLILELVCCRIPETFSGLDVGSASHAPDSCRWDGGTFRDGEKKEWDLDFLEVSCDDSLSLTLRATRSGTGYKATVTLRLVLGPGDPDDEGLSLLNVDYDIDVDVELKWWARAGFVLAGVIIGLVSGGLWWALGGGAIGVGVVLAIEAILSFSLSKAIPTELEDLPDLVRVLPPELTDLLGNPVARDTLWDDLEMSGDMRAPEVENPPVRIELPQLLGEPLRAATRALEALDLVVTVVRRDDEAPSDTVIGQDPVAKTLVHRGATVEFTVSKGPSGPRLVVPDVTGKPDHAAQAELRGAGFQNLNLNPVSGPPSTHMQVVSQSPQAGKEIAAHSPITLHVSDGKDTGDGGGGRGNGHHPPQPK